MCGIAGIYLKDSFHGQYDVEGLVDGLFLGIEPRGRDASGIVSVTKGGGTVTLEKDDIEAKHFILLRHLLPDDLRFALCHTRLATKGDQERNENNHPVNYKTCFATHNGVIRNDDTLFEQNEWDRVAEVDSIVVPTMITESGGMDKALEVLPKLVGSWALAICDPTTHPDEVLLVKGNANPLVILNHPKLVMWASTKNAIEDAWKMVIGTPPKYNKYTHLNDGEFFRIKEGGLVETGRFMEKPKPSRSFRTPHDWESGRSRSYPGAVSDRPMCFECGDRISFYKIEDSYRDEERGTTVSWDVPVCFQCSETLASDLTYRYATDKLRVRVTRDNSCELCQQNPGTETGKHGASLCLTCFEDEKRDWKPVATFRGDDPNAEKFLTLRPGDTIPMEMRSAFNGCENCQSKLVSFIGKDGFAVCGMCKVAEDGAPVDDDGEGIDCLQCDVCEHWAPVTDMVSSCFGTVCERCCDKNGWEIHPSDDPDACGVEVVKREPVPRAVNLLKYIREAEAMYPMGHKFTACEQTISAELLIHLPLVAWLLEGCPVRYLNDDTDLHEIYERVSGKYARIMGETK